MEPVLNRKEDVEIQHAHRAQRIEQMKQEKLLQEKRRRMLRQYLPLCVSIIGVVTLLIIGIAAVVLKTDNHAQQMQIADTRQRRKSFVTENSEETTEKSAENKEGTAVSELICVGIDREKATQEKSTETQMEQIIFTSNDDTATIYSEEVTSTNAILVDENTDMIIASKGAKERINPASMTKVLTVLVAAEQLTEADLDDTFTMTKEITDYAYVNDCSSVGFLDGEKVAVRDLFYGTVLPSGGDAAVGLATYIAGSHEAFVDMMNEKLEDLGLAESAHFTNCVGLFDEDHYCTVYDMAVIMKAVVQNDMCREFLSAKKYTTAPTTEHPEGITISNWFLRRIEDKDSGGEVLCAKTGYVVESKNCAVSYGTFAGGTPYICVTVGATSNWRCIYDHVEIYNRYVPDGE